MLSTKLKNKLNKLPNEPGVYIFSDSTNKVIYIGKSVSLKKRVKSYFARVSWGHKTDTMIKKIADINFIKVFSEFEALLLESALIKNHKPFFNVQAKDDKSPLYIKIVSDGLPLVTTTRKENKKRGVFIKGPFPSTVKTQQLLRIVRRIFPYCHHKNPKKPCLYVHLGLCPYPYQSKNAREKYLKSIGFIKQLLSGKSLKVVKNLQREMQNLSYDLKYEEAQIVKNQIQDIKTILSRFHTPSEFIQTPTLVEDTTLLRLKDLKTQLSLPSIPGRIECYDISNISGQQATGSMAVFTNGVSDKSQYRRFRIKFTHKPDDYEMIREVIGRRLKNEWKLPDLIIIDGGRGQLTSAMAITTKYKIFVPVVSLAKKHEKIYTPGQNMPISLPKESPARQLVQSIRDEAHRFALRYHRFLRSKKFLES